MVDGTKDSGTKGRSSTMGETKDWEALGRVPEGGSDNGVKTNGSAVVEKSAKKQVVAESGAVTGTGKTGEQSEGIQTIIKVFQTV